MAKFSELTPKQQEEFHLKVLDLCKNFVYKMQPKYYYQYKGDLEDLAMECYTRFFEPAKDAYSHDKEGNIIYVNKETGERVDENDPMATPKIYRKTKNAGLSMADIYDPEKLGGKDWTADDDKKLAAFVQNFVYHRLIDFSKEDQIQTVSVEESRDDEDKGLTWERLKSDIISEELPREYSDDDILEMRDRFDELPLKDKQRLKEWFEENYKKEGAMSAEAFDIMLDVLSGDMTESEIKKAVVSNGKQSPASIREIAKKLGAETNVSNGSDRRLRIWFNDESDRAANHKAELEPYFDEIEKAGYKFQKFSGHGAYFTPTEGPSYKENKGGKSTSNDIAAAVATVTDHPVQEVKANGRTRLRIVSEGVDKDALDKALEPLGFTYYTTSRGNLYYDKPLVKDTANEKFVSDLISTYNMNCTNILRAYDDWASDQERIDFMAFLSKEHDMPESLDNSVIDYLLNTPGTTVTNVVNDLENYLTDEDAIAFKNYCIRKS